ncbi:MAG TPA: hypothetical protein VGJ48_25770 [Pyrinomonadaceae bacterium]
MDRRKFLELPLYGLPLLVAGRVVGQNLQTVSSLKQKAPVVVRSQRLSVARTDVSGY